MLVGDPGEPTLKMTEEEQQHRGHLRHMVVLAAEEKDGQDGQDNLDEKTNLSVDSAFCQLVKTKVEPGMPSRVNLVVVIIIMVAMVAVVIIGWLSSSSLGQSRPSGGKA